MVAARISATDDIPQVVLDELAESLSAMGASVEIDELRTSLRSAAPPSWISFIAEADWWVQGLSIYAAVFVGEIVRQAGKATWEKKGQALHALVGTANRVARLASALIAAKARSRSDTYLTIGIPIPDEIVTAALRRQSTDADELAVELAFFIHHLPALAQLLSDCGVPQGTAVGGVFLDILPDGRLEAKWIDRDSLQERRHVLDLNL